MLNLFFVGVVSELQKVRFMINHEYIQNQSVKSKYMYCASAVHQMIDSSRDLRRANFCTSINPPGCFLDPWLEYSRALKSPLLRFACLKLHNITRKCKLFISKPIIQTFYISTDIYLTICIMFLTIYQSM